MHLLTIFVKESIDESEYKKLLNLYIKEISRLQRNKINKNDLSMFINMKPVMRYSLCALFVTSGSPIPEMLLKAANPSGVIIIEFFLETLRLFEDAAKNFKLFSM